MTIVSIVSKVFIGALLLMPSDTARRRRVDTKINMSPRINNQTMQQKARELDKKFDSLELEIKKCKKKKP